MKKESRIRHFHQQREYKGVPIDTDVYNDSFIGQGSVACRLSIHACFVLMVGWTRHACASSRGAQKSTYLIII
jgi:hypothetical protein